jgi:hypothetical protein
MVEEIVCEDCKQVFYDWRDVVHHFCYSPAGCGLLGPAGDRSRVKTPFTYPVKGVQNTPKIAERRQTK